MWPTDIIKSWKYVQILSKTRIFLCNCRWIGAIERQTIRNCTAITNALQAACIDIWLIKTLVCSNIRKNGENTYLSILIFISSWLNDCMYHGETHLNISSRRCTFYSVGKSLKDIQNILQRPTRVAVQYKKAEPNYILYSIWYCTVKIIVVTPLLFFKYVHKNNSLIECTTSNNYRYQAQMTRRNTCI